MGWKTIAAVVLGAGALAGSGKAAYDASVSEADRRVAAERAERARSIDELTQKFDAEFSRRDRESAEAAARREAYQALLAQRRADASAGAYLILNEITFDLVYERLNAEKGAWEEMGGEYGQVATAQGNGVGVYRKDGKLYVITDAHLIPREQTEYHPFNPFMRRTFRPKKQELSLVTRTGHKDGKLELGRFPLEVLAADDEDHALVATKPCPDCGTDAAGLGYVKAIGRSSALKPGDKVYNVSKMRNVPVEIPHTLKLDEMVIEYQREGIVESLGSPTSPSDDTIQHIKTDAQPGMSGSGVYNERGELVGLIAYGLHHDGDATRTIEGIKAFLDKHGFGHLLEREY
jgi:hypothetical protein